VTRLNVTAFNLMARWAPFLLMLFGCATAPPPDLVSAREAYAHAGASTAARAAPADLHKAKVALDRAETAFVAQPGGEETRDLAYIAECKAMTAEALGGAALGEARKREDRAAFEKKQGQLLAGAEKALDAAALAQIRTSNDLAVEKEARSEAEQKAVASDKIATAATDALAALAAKDEARGKVITLSGSVLFRTSQSTLLPGATTRLDQVAAALVTSRPRRVVVEGHTDSRGSREGNEALSQRRADAVRTYLIARGFPSDKIEAHGVGQDVPVSDNDTVEGRANNRRVEIVLPAGDQASAR
jgi:outer membrane protein OmpA-like peptidoglycan-associated protein